MDNMWVKFFVRTFMNADLFTCYGGNKSVAGFSFYCDWHIRKYRMEFLIDVDLDWRRQTLLVCIQTDLKLRPNNIGRFMFILLEEPFAMFQY